MTTITFQTRIRKKEVIGKNIVQLLTLYRNNFVVGWLVQVNPDSVDCIDQTFFLKQDAETTYKHFVHLLKENLI